MTDHPDNFENTMDSLRSLRWDSNRRNSKIEAGIGEIPEFTQKSASSFYRRSIVFAFIFFLLVGGTYAAGGWNFVRGYFFHVKLEGPDGEEFDGVIRLIEDGRFESSAPNESKKIFEKKEPVTHDKNKELPKAIKRKLKK